MKELKNIVIASQTALTTCATNKETVTINEMIESDNSFKYTCRYMDFRYDGVTPSKRGSNFTPKKKKRKKKC